jgi:hypothetical protein
MLHFLFDQAVQRAPASPSPSPIPSFKLLQASQLVFLFLIRQKTEKVLGKLQKFCNCISQ